MLGGRKGRELNMLPLMSVFSVCLCVQVRGISGGQVKRVNVGLELVAEPSVLFLVSRKRGANVVVPKLQRSIL